jgi:spore maturation protein CgeB
MDDPVERHARAERGQRAVLARHTFERRADELIAAVASVAANVPTAIARQR